MLREVAAKLVAEVDGKEVKGFMDLIDRAKGALASFGVALAAGAIGSFIKGQIDAADALDESAGRLGISTDQLQEFAYGLELASGSSEGAEKAIFFLTKAIGEAAGGAGPAADAFREMGINVKDANGHVGEALDILPSIADAVKNAGTQAEKTAIASKIFGKAAINMVPYLERGAEGVKALSAEFKAYGGGYSKDFIKQAAEAKDSLQRFHVATKSVTSSLLALFMPAIVTVMEFIARWSARITRLARETNVLKYVLAALGTVIGFKVLPVIMSTVRTLAALRTAFFGVSVPLLPFIALVGGLALILEDLFVMMNGGESVIGDLFDKFGTAEEKKNLIDSLREAWSTFTDALDQTLPVLEDIWKSLAEGATESIPMLAEAMITVVKAIVAGIDGFASLIKAMGQVEQGDFSGALKTMEASGGRILGKEMSMKKIDAQGNVTEVKENVGGLFGISKKEYDKRLQAAGLAPVTNHNDVKVAVEINAANMSSDEAQTATTKGVANAMENAYGAVVKPNSYPNAFHAGFEGD